VNEWEIAAAVLGFALIPCIVVCLLRPPPDGLVALQIGGVIVCTILMLLAEGFRRQPFIEMAYVLAPMALIGSLVFARLMERHL
jgi:multisubunit Na+/H+ antiporter MnhF subunit